MAIIGATQLDPVNVLGSYVQGMEMGRANQLAQQQAALAQQQQARAEQQFQMQMADRDRELKRQQLQEKRDSFALLGQIAGTAIDQPTYDQALATLKELGVDTTNIPSVFDPKKVKTFRDSTLTEAQRLDLEIRKGTLGVQEIQARTAATQARTAAAEEKRLTQLATQPSADDLVVARTETAADGTVRMYNKFGKLLKTEKGAGKPSAQFERSRAVKAETQKNLNEVISSLEDISKKDGLIDQSTGSGIGRGVDVVAGFFGQSTPGAEAIARLKPIADQVLKLVPRFEGPQSDKDTQSYREAAGQLGDPTLPSAVRKAAAKEIIDIYKRRKNQFTISGEELTVAPSEGWGNLEVVE
jgi:hypothetical protein